MRNITISGTFRIETAANIIRGRLPNDWTVEIDEDLSKGHYIIRIKASNLREISIHLMSRKQINPKDIRNLTHQNESISNLLVAAPFLSPRSRELLREMGINYLDSTGNLRLVIKNPAVFIESEGEDKNPKQQNPRLLRSLKGSAAGRVVRALCDFLPPYGVRELAELSSTSLGTVSRVITLLEEDALITRDEKGKIIDVDWIALLKHWVRSYNVSTSNIVNSYLDPRGLSGLTEKLHNLKRYAVTGSIASSHIAPPRLAMIYVENANVAANTLELTPTESGANVWLLEPYDKVVFERTQLLQINSTKTNAIKAAALSQVVADLLTSPGRGPQEAQDLIEKMKGSEHDWRIKP